jgi:thiol-disulfide isomerase/thioredoxin
MAVCFYKFGPILSANSKTIFQSMRYFFLFFLLISVGAIGQPRVVKLAEVEKILKTQSDQIQVINFWATWCGPCVKEMPLIENVGRQRTDVRITLVSLDLDLDDNPEKVFKFVERKGIQSTVLILDEPDPNSWIDKIEKQWNGSLPATLIVNTKTGKRAFAGKELKDGELDKLIDSVK